MKLNIIKPKVKPKGKRRVGRGIGSGLGKTCTRGHKGQRARAGGYHKLGFEGGQMPHQRRVPKFGFNSYLKRITEEVGLGVLEKIKEKEITVKVLKKENLIARQTRYVKVILSGTINRAVITKGLRVTSGAKEAIEKHGGQVMMGS